MLTKKSAISVPVVPSLDPPDIMTPEEVAAMLKVQPTWVYEKLRHRRKARSLPAFKIGRYLRFSRREVLAWVESTRISHAAGKRAA